LGLVPLLKFALKTRGASHIEKNLPCQDATDAILGLNEKVGIACVADGHGSIKHFRSDKGSNIAVNIASRCLADFFGSVTRENISFFQSLFTKKTRNEEIKIDDIQSKIKQLEANIIYKWRNAVLEDLNNNPLTEAEIEICTQNNIPYDNLTDLIFIYGSTLLAGLFSDNFWFVIQIGDGLCVVLENEEKIFSPIPEDERLAFGRTTSLCDNDAINNFRESYGFSPIMGLTVATDGLADSFEPDKYLQFNKELYEKFSHFPVRAETELQEFLPKISERGSRDDISIAGIFKIMELNKALA
jgi:serine/threonine protein phosphatase PrpC